MTTNRRPARTVKLPPPTDVDRQLVLDFITAIGHDPARVSSVRINRARVEVDVATRPDVKLTVRHPVVFPDAD